MSKKHNNAPDWCVVLSFHLASRCMSAEDIIEAIMLDVEMSGEDYAKRKWKRMADGKVVKQ